MCIANNEKQKKKNNESNRTARSKKNQNAWRKGNLQVFRIGILEADTIKQAEMKEKIKEYLRRRRKLRET